MTLWLAPHAAWAVNCTFTATVNENSGANFLYFGNSTSGNNADACINFGFIHGSGSSALGSWTSTGAGTDGGTQGPDNQITYTPATGAVGTDNFSIAADAFAPNDSTVAVTITIAAVPPSVSSVSPTSGSTSGGTSVTITGTAFTGATQVSFGGTPSAGIVASSDSSITATAPAHAAGTVDIRVTTAGGTSAISSSDHYIYAVPPAATQSIASTTLTQNHAATLFTPVTGSGGTTPFSYSVSPSLPSGLSMAATTGAITGTPTVASSATTYTVTVTDANSLTATATFSLAVNSAVTATQAIASTTLTQNHAATSFTPVTGSGGTAPLTYSVSPSLPSGLSMAAATGAITGTPTATSSATAYTVTVTDANSLTATATFSLTVNSAVTATQAIASTSLTINHAATSFAPVTGSGGTAPLSYSVSPSLPSGLSMAAATGAITGTPTAASSATTYTVTVADANSATATATFSLTVNSAVTATQAIASTSLTINHVTTSFRPVTGSGGTAPLTYSVSPSLPSGLSMAATTGAITGTPTATSSATTYTVTVIDANSATATATFSLTVNSAVTATQAIASTTLTQNHAATSFTPVTGSGGTTPLSYSVSPSLPSGLSMAAATGAITGTPTATSSATAYTVTVTDANSLTATVTFSLTVNSAVTATQAIASTSLTINHAATSFTPVTGSGGTTPLAYSISPGLPSGLSMAAATGAITGTPTAASSATTYTVTVSDANSATATATFSLTVNSAVTATQAIASTSLTINHAATSFTPVTGSGGTTPLSYSVSPVLPSGLSMAAATGAITGTPTVTSSAAAYTVTVTDSNSATATATFSLTVTAPTIALAPTTLPTPVIGAGYSQTITASGGSAPYSYAISAGALPPGLSPSAAGALTGTPTGVGTFSFTVTATDANGFTGNRAYSFAISAPTIAVTPAALPGAVLGTAYSQTVTASGGTLPYTYSIGSGALPTGLTLNASSGVMSGTPAAGTFSFTVKAVDSTTGTGAPYFGAQAYSIAVSAPTPTLAVAMSGSPASVTVGSNITYSISLTVGTGTATNVSLSDPLPAGFGFVSAGVTGPGGAWTCTTPAAGSGGTVTCSIASAAPATYNLAIVAHVAVGTPAGSVTNTATASAGNATTVSGSATNSVILQTTSVAVASSLNPSLVGQSVTFTATVSASSGTPTGTVTFKDGVATLGTGTLSGGVATLATSALTGGPHAITAVYGGDGNFLGNTSPALTQTVNVTSATTASLASSVNPSAPGQAVTFTARVTSAGGTPTGLVTFSDGGTAIGSGPLAGGAATLTIASLTAGAHNITASYGGAAGFAASTSSALTQTVAIPADSIKLRQLQVAVTQVVAQNSGQAISGAIDTAIADGFSDGGSLVAPSGTGLRFNFSADDSDRPDASSATSSEKVVSDRWNGMFGRDGTSSNDARGYARNQPNTSRVDDALAAINRSTMATKAPPSIGREPKDWLLWAEVRESGIDRWGSTMGTGSSLLYGMQVNALMGLTRKVTPSFLIGWVGGYETFDYTSQDLNGKLKGNGWTVGSYLGWKLTTAIRFDAAVAYSGIGYDGTAGTAQGNFDGRRWMVTSGLTGNYQAYGFDVEPSARIYALWEHENAYTDSLGTQQADRDFATGRASAGVKLAYPFHWTDTVALAPYAGLYGDCYFTDDNAAAILVAGATPLVSTPLLDGWSARGTAGLAARFTSGAAIAVGGELGGIGSGTRVWTYRARASVPF